MALRVLILFVSAVCATNKMCAKLDTFGPEISRNTYRPGEVISTVDNTELVTCMQTCLQFNLCTFINFNTQLGVCYLMTPKDNSTTLGGTPASADSRDVVSSMASSWSRDIIHGPCLNHDCPNNSYCIDKDKDTRECQVIGCVGSSLVPYIDNSRFEAKTMWKIDDAIILPCLYDSSGPTSCTADGSWSEFECHQAPPTDCSDAINKNYTVGAVPITIDVDGGGPLDKIEVLCDGMVTVVYHNATAKTLVDGFNSPYSFKLHLQYTVSLDHIRVIKQNSNNCEQFLRYDCFGSRLIGYAAWRTIHQQRAYYFAGNGTDSESCACGIGDSCDKTGVKCNCNINDNVWRDDSDFITNITALPITAFEAGDTGFVDYYDERAFVSIGPLRCQ
ncbi:contactin-associated protein-like 2 [Patella vulgata]|uniref:contactin-associated protein-like 2 n=1 Tax=Patella vulgata TaxID=6465 RepID=UPI0024A7A97B|nr:contactin-associated protein-like 2 [Patella vulgata]